MNDVLVHTEGFRSPGTSGKGATTTAGKRRDSSPRAPIRVQAPSWEIVVIPHERGQSTIHGQRGSVLEVMVECLSLGSGPLVPWCIGCVPLVVVVPGSCHDGSVHGWDKLCGPDCGAVYFAFLHSACPMLDRDVMLRMSRVAIVHSFGRQTPALIASGGLGR